MIHLHKKRVTIGDLALELGLSTRAVSQALNPRDSNVKLSPKTVERIQQLARERNYRPDSRARAMRYGRFNNIGYFEAKRKADSWPLLGAESGICDVASEHRYRVGLIRLPSDPPQGSDSIPSVFREGNLDALILSHAGNLSPELEDVIDASGFPVVYLNEKKKKNAVYVDDYRAAIEITRHVISQGKRRIVYLGTVERESHYSGRDRMLGYRKAMEKAGLKAEVVEATERNPHWERDLRQWFRTHSEVEAIVAYSDYAALQVFRLIRGSSREIPRNLLLTGFGDDFGKECSPVPLTTMRIPFYEMGRAAAEMALELITKGSEAVPARAFAAELVVRESSMSA